VAPINTRLAALGRQAAAAGRRPGDLSAADLVAALSATSS
jgi:hypothetical protein